MYTKSLPVANIVEPNEHIDLLSYEELVTLSGGNPVKPLAGWKALAFLVGGTCAAIIVGIAATYVIYKGVKYIIS